MVLIATIATTIERLGGMRTAFFALIAFVLPWQTRLIVGGIPLVGGETEYGTIGVYAVEALFLVGFSCFVLCDRPAWRVRVSRAAAIALVLFVVAVAASLRCTSALRSCLRWRFATSAYAFGPSSSLLPLVFSHQSCSGFGKR